MRPVFIGGCDRSGTTLLGAMLGAHSECLCVPESQFKIDVLRSLERVQPEVDLPSAFNMIKNHWRFKLWELDIDLSPAVEKAIEGSYPGLIKWIINRYGEKVGKPDSSIWVDHTPTNLKYAATLASIFHEAKFLHIVRDGRAVAASVIPLDWGPNTIINAAHWWVEKVAYGLSAESFLGKGQVIRLRYEDLVREPTPTLKRVCSLLDINYQSEMLKGSGFKVPRFTSAQHALVGNPPDSSRVEAWQKELSSREVEIFESLTGDSLYLLGYKLKYGLKARGPTKIERVISAARELWRRQFVNRISISRRKSRLVE